MSWVSPDDPLEPADPFVVEADRRWQDAGDCVDHIERHNCIRGCRRGMADAQLFVDLGPAGSCDLIRSVYRGVPLLEFFDNGRVVQCLVREPL